jgi:hypothetical protein
MKSLGMDSRTSFLKHDLTKPLKSEVPYDLAISNLVFHNMGKKRFKAYGTVFDALKPGGYFVIGDLFPHGIADMDYFRERANLMKVLFAAFCIESSDMLPCLNRSTPVMRALAKHFATTSGGCSK